MRLPLFSAAIVVTVLSGVEAQAIEGYSADLTNQFVSWCSTSQNQPQTVCSCAVNQASVQIPAAGLASFLNAPQGSGLAATSQGVGASALQIVTACAASSGGGSGAAVGAAIGAAGGLLGSYGK